MAASCDPCTCPEQFYRDEVAWRKAVLTLLCRLIEQMELANATLNVVQQNTLPE